MVETGRAAAFVMDDILLYSLAAQSRNPGDLRHLGGSDFGRALRHHACARTTWRSRRWSNAAMTNIYKSGQINAIYEKWFQKPIPPKGLNLNIPMSDQFKRVVANPTDSGDPAAYK